MEELEKAVAKIIKSIEPGRYFDTHTLIFLMFQKHHDVYLSAAGAHASSTAYHAAISKLVKANTDLVDFVGESYSKNFLDHFSDCHLWLRKKTKKKDGEKKEGEKKNKPADAAE